MTKTLMFTVPVIFFAGLAVAAEGGLTVTGPDDRIEVSFRIDAEGTPRYTIDLDGNTVLAQSRLGVVREDADLSKGLKLVSASAVEPVQDKYELLTGKRRINTYVGQRRVFHLQAPGGEKMDVIFQVSNDAVAFRYYFPEKREQVHRIRAEASSFRFLPETRAWLQPIAVAKSGWSETNPSYEEIYEKDIIVGTPSPTGAGWVFPALFRSGETWLLLSETGLARNYAGARLQSHWRSAEYTIAFPSPLEGTLGGPVNPESTLPWLTPWRLIVIGELATIVESTLGTDLADKPAVGAHTPADAPGKASWSWPLLGDAQTSYETQKRFIDYAAQMGWRYTLVDALWDQQIGYEKLEELVDYARGKDVRILVWYNSAGDWNKAPQTPRNKLLTHESRIREFERLKQIGVAGLKVDFFAGDGQSTIAYYHDILQDTARYGFLMNFHGSTLPRGWHRTYPHLMTMEAVRGLEFVTFEQKNAEDEPSHAAMLPFTRNVFDPMDFTPVVLDRIERIERRTTSAFELALSVLFTSGIQHYAEIPSGMAKAPDYVREFLRHVPSIWDDVKFLAGEPGKFVALARRSEGRWYVAGINGENSARTLHLDLSNVPAHGSGTLIMDGEGGNLSFHRETVSLDANKQFDVELQPRGGFVAVFE
jgi:hypothetical protein